MGDSACLMRSFSQPSSVSREAKEDDPLRALGESISFGRYMSESLAWEKWSSFSHNRYLEEVEKFSKPGSVAQKKAYFEAHYKRAAAKKAAALLAEANAAANDVSGSEVTNEIQDASYVDSESAEANSYVAIDKPQEIEVSNSELVFSADSNAKLERNEIISNVGTNKVENSNVKWEEPVMMDGVLGKNTNEVKNLNPLEIVEKQDNMMVNQKDKILIKEAARQENFASTNKKKPPISSSKLSTSSRSSKQPSPAKALSSVKPRKENNDTPNSKKSTKESVDKKRLTPKSLHMSINFASHAGEASRKASPNAQKFGYSRTPVASVRMSKGSSTPLQTTLASLNRESKHPPVTPQLENQRTKTLPDHSFSGSGTGDGKWRSLFLDRSKSKNACGSKAQSPTIFASFNFRSEERAAKRKEFSLKLEERINAKEIEKVQQQTKSKEKAEEDLKKLRQSASFRAKPNFHHETQSPNNHMKKMPPRRPQSPKLGKKPTPSSVQDAKRPSLRTDESRHVTKKNNQTTSRSVISLPRKNTRENASPNIPA